MAPKGGSESSTRSKAASKAAATRAYNRQVREAAAQREAFEAANPERFQTIQDLPGAGASPRQSYRLMGYTDKAPNLWGQMELEGPKGADVWHGQHRMVPDRDMMPVPRRWEEFSDEEKNRVLRAAAKFGVTPESAYRSLAAQVDSAYRAEGGHHDSFYDPADDYTRGGNLTPRARLKESARQNQVPFGVQAAANAITSPQNRFVQRDKEGRVTYPNDEAASHAIQWAKKGGTGESYLYHKDYYVPPSEKVERTVVRGGQRRTELAKRPDDPRSYPVSGYPRNHALAIDVTRSVLGGARLADAWKPTAGEKVAAYHNSWVDPHGSSQFWVSDTHSGGAAFAPHLPKKGPGSQEAYMGIKGIHAFHDHIARKVMQDRGLNSLTNMQSAQWNEEKRRRGDGDDAALNTYGKTQDLHTGVHPGQGRLF